MRYLIYKKRTNASGTDFYSLFAMTLEELKDYSNSAQDKTIKAAINAMNKDYDRRYSNCYRQSCWVTLAGKADVEKFSITENSRESLFRAVEGRGIDTNALNV